jgi:hypothetical protein
MTTYLAPDEFEKQLFQIEERLHLLERFLAAGQNASDHLAEIVRWYDRLLCDSGTEPNEIVRHLSGLRPPDSDAILRDAFERLHQLHAIYRNRQS